MLAGALSFVIGHLVGMGAGKRAYATPGILRAMIIEPVE